MGGLRHGGYFFLNWLTVLLTTLVAQSFGEAGLCVCARIHLAISASEQATEARHLTVAPHPVSTLCTGLFLGATVMNAKTAQTIAAGQIAVQKQHACSVVMADCLAPFKS